MSTVYVVIIEDRHADVDAEVYADKEAALDAAWNYAVMYNSFPEDLDDHALSAAMIRDGWLRYVKYSQESDSVRVVERELRERG